MAIKINPDLLASLLAKSKSEKPANTLYPMQWTSKISNPGFGAEETFMVLNPAGDHVYDSMVRTETPGEINIVVREADGAIAFVYKYRNIILPHTPENEAWRNSGNLDLLSAPHLGMDMLELTRGWTYKKDSPWKMMTEGQEETGLMVTNIEKVGQCPYVYCNTGIVSTWIDLSWGFATDKPYGETVDEIEKFEIKKVVWLTPAEIRQFVDKEPCALSCAALNKFRVFALNSTDSFLQELGKQL
jgi:hypothetical protein